MIRHHGFTVAITLRLTERNTMNDRTEIAIVGKFAQLKPANGYHSSADEILVTIGTTQERDGNVSPRNFRLEFDTPKNSSGGCKAMIWASDSEYSKTIQETNYFGQYGPEILMGASGDYAHALRAVERINKRMAALEESRGHAIDAADQMGRWLEACGIKAVWKRATQSEKEEWLDRGEWVQYTVGQFVNMVRRNLYVKPVAPVAVAEPVESGVAA